MKKAKSKRFDWRLLLSVFLMVTVLGVVASVISLDRNDYSGYAPMNGYHDLYLTEDEIIESYPNVFPDLRGVLSATVNGVTVESAVANMGAGRISITEVNADSTFVCTLASEVLLSPGYVYYGYYRTETTDFTLLPKATELGPFTVELVDEDNEAVWSGDLTTGLTVSKETTATVNLHHCMDGETPHIESGMYQIYIIAVEK